MGDDDGFVRERVEVRRRRPIVPVDAEMIGAERVDGDEDNVWMMPVDNEGAGGGGMRLQRVPGECESGQHDNAHCQGADALALVPRLLSRNHRMPQVYTERRINQGFS